MLRHYDCPWCDFNGEVDAYTGQARFCPSCGRPLDDEAPPAPLTEAHVRSVLEALIDVDEFGYGLRTEDGLLSPIRSVHEGDPEMLLDRARGCYGNGDLVRAWDRQFGIPENYPEIVCLCGSTRFDQTYREEQFRLTVEGKVVLTVAGNWKDDHDDVWDEIDDEDKEALDELHLRKIDLADRVHVLNVDGYVGSSTENEVRHAIQTGTEVTWLEPDRAPLQLISDAEEEQ